MLAFSHNTTTLSPARESSPLAASVAALADDKLSIPLAKYRELIIVAAKGEVVTPAAMLAACEAANKPLAGIDRDIEVARDGLRMRREMTAAAQQLPDLEAAADEAFAKWRDLEAKLQALTKETQQANFDANAAGNRASSTRDRANSLRLRLNEPMFSALLGDAPASMDAIAAKG